MLTLLILSFGVAADATAVSIAASVRGVSVRRGMLMAFLFGAAQSAMAALGWFGGTLIGRFWMAWDHWIALALLTFVGVKMIKEAFEAGDDDAGNAGAGTWMLLILALATSLDALAVGISLPTLGEPPAIALTLIGVVTFACSAAGALLGRRLGERFGRAIEVIGGLALIAIGISIVLEHT
jgi:putative Mn2+ efflux pump MntP